VRIAFVITRAASVDETWTTVHLARAALDRGDTVRFIEPWDFEIDSMGRLLGRAHAFDMPVPDDQLAALLSQRRAPRRYVDLHRIDLMLLRAAPLDPSILTFAALVKENGVRVVNDPEGLLRVSHKAWLATIPDLQTPPSVVTRSRASCQVFYGEHRDGVVVKPARGSGGRAVSRVYPGNPAALDQAFDRARDVGDGYVVVQAYLPEAEEGEKRLVWLDGDVIGGYLRRRAPGEFRHNLKRGGLAEPTTITDEDAALVRQITPYLTQTGVRLAGLDVIGGNLIEVNTLNPGGAFHADRLTGSHLAELILARLSQPLEAEKAKWAVPAP